ncbi:MAG: tRNA (adenosine(37)-N6)-threonylcarbamoyltransferase complex ATPase subunit type 1 TsaE [Candidatus Moranbacteria bacterium]|nr:tRNA (adenosine(37)-N6)-threonylcarbamoyltransferase complex ATPase subunit type 1 TsaE [Candidatus Moranbacteria bacterium]
MEQNTVTHSAQETRDFGQKLAGEISPGTLLCLRGDLGAGKTTLVQGLLEGLGAERPYVSPTFVIMKQYDLLSPSTTGTTRVYHADAYRVEAKDFTEIGFTEWCADPQGLVILEWPEHIADILPEKRIDITITSLSETEREITYKEKTATM